MAGAGDTGWFRTLRMDASHGFAVAALTGCIDGDALPLDLRYRTSTDAVAALARRECDLTGFHIFLLLVREHYYFALRRDAVDEPIMRQLLELMRDPAYQRLVVALPGYDACGTGELVSIAEAFSLPA